MRVALASERPAKVEAVRAALRRLSELGIEGWNDAEIVAQATESGVGATPRHDDELRRGALQRAQTLERALVAAGTPADLYLGLEGGVHVERGVAGGGGTREDVPSGTGTAPRLWLRSWAYAWDGRRGAFGCGPSLLLPDSLALPVLRGEDLGQVIDRVAGDSDVRSRGGTWGFLTRGALQRSLAFETAVLAALAPFYHREGFGDSGRRS